MTELVESVSRVAQIIGEITHAIEQSDRVSQITASVGLLDRARRRTPPWSSSRPRPRSAWQAAKLNESVAVFRV